MCRCAERGVILVDAVKSLSNGDIAQVAGDASLFVKTVRDDVVDIVRMPQAVLSAAMARLGNFR